MAIRTLKDTGSEYTIPCEVDGSVYSLITDDCVIAGRGNEFALNYSLTSLVASVEKSSQALLCGNALWLTDDESVTLPANSTFYLCLRIDTSQPNGQTGSLVCLTESAMKSDNINEGGIRDMALYKITTSGSGVTACDDVRNICDASDYATKEYVDTLKDEISTLDNNKLNIGIDITGTLSASSTSITLTSNKITANSILDFYTSIYGVSPNTAEVSEGKVTLTFDKQNSDMTVGVKIIGSY